MSITRKLQMQCAVVGWVVKASSTAQHASPHASLSLSLAQASPGGQTERWPTSRSQTGVRSTGSTAEAPSASHHMPLETLTHCSSRAVVQQALSQSILAVGRSQSSARCHWTPQAAGCTASDPRSEADGIDGTNHPSGRGAKQQTALQLVRISECWRGGVCSMSVFKVLCAREVRSWY
ncbi:hypothetical protein J3F83DRAFT_697212 [Trichoderma novae-zelandiae]